MADLHCENDADGYGKFDKVENGETTVKVFIDELLNDPELVTDDIFGGDGENCKQKIKDDTDKTAFADIKKQKYGKFKNPEELLKAYCELEKAFTKKAQSLKELECRCSKMQTAKSADKSDGQPIGGVSGCECGEGGKYEAEEEFRRGADKFFKEIPAARKYAAEIAEQFVLRPELNSAPQPLERALLGVIASKIRTPEQLLSDGQFLNGYVLNNEKVKKAVLENYIKELGCGLPPVTLSHGGFIAAAPEKQPKSIEEAGIMFLTDNKIKE